MFRLLVLLLILPAFPCFAQKINDISNENDALSFVRKIDTLHPTLYITPIKPVWGYSVDSIFSLSSKVLLFEKADFDNNGCTDLLFNGFQCYDESSTCSRKSLVIFSYGNDSFQVKEISKYKYRGYFAARVLSIGNQAMIGIMHASFERKPNADSVFIKRGADTLVYAFGHFIEFQTPSASRIEKISYDFSCGFSVECSNIKITITSDSSWLKKDYFINGDYCTQFSRMQTPPDLWKKLTEILNNINFYSLNNEYKVPWTCDATGYLSILFDNSETKIIEDYGLMGTYGLEAIHHILFDLKDSYSWIMLKEEGHF